MNIENRFNEVDRYKENIRQFRRDILDIARVAAIEGRIRIGLTQEELSKKTGYSQSYISQVEIGKKVITREYFKKIMNLSESI